jgi:hypothetical protein
MVHDLASGINATCSWTRIFTLLRQATLIKGTICTDDTLRTAVRRTTNVIDKAGAYCNIIDLTALGVGTTRRWLTWVDYGFISFNLELNNQLGNTFERNKKLSYFLEDDTIRTDFHDSLFGKCKLENGS